MLYYESCRMTSQERYRLLELEVSIGLPKHHFIYFKAPLDKSILLVFFFFCTNES